MKKLFLLGNPRSGTSLFRLMLNAHANIAAPPECGFLQWWYPKYKEWSGKNINTEDITAYVKDLLSSKKIETWRLIESELINFLLISGPQNYEKLTEAVYIYWAKANDRKNVDVIVDKNNYYIHHLKELSTIWSEASFLFLVRDGRDVACSYLDVNRLQTNSPYKPKLPNQISDIAKEWNDNNLRIEKFLQDLSKGRSFQLNYENLVSKPEEALKAVCTFMGIDFDDSMLDYYLVNRSRQEEPLSTLDWKKKTLEKPDKDNIGKYLRILTRAEIETFESIAHDSLVKFGYNLLNETSYEY